MKINLRAVRQDRMITQTELAKKSGLSRGAICKIESGATREVKSDTLSKLASSLGVTINDLFLP